MFSYPRYPHNNNYYSKKGQIIRNINIYHEGPLSAEQIKQAYNYFIKKGILQIPHPPVIIGKFDTIYLRNEDTISTVKIEEVENNNAFDIERGNYYLLIFKPDGQ